MAILTAAGATKGRTSTIANKAGEVIAVASTFDLAVHGVPVVDDLLRLLPFPAGHVLVGAVLETDALTTMAVDIGLEAGTNDEVFDAQSVATAAHVVGSKAGLSRVSNTGSTDVWLTAKVTAAPTVSTGKFTVVFIYRPLVNGE